MMEQEFQFFDDLECELYDSENTTEERILKVRLDKWLWAARFFKTRALARAAVEAGKVFYNGERSKPSREIELGAELYIRQGRFEKTVMVKGLSTRRRSTEEALQLFEETHSAAYQGQVNVPQEYWQHQHHSQHQNYNNAYTENQQNYYPEQRERRTTRFLRRSSMRQPNQRPEQYDQSSRYLPKEVPEDYDNETKE